MKIWVLTFTAYTYEQYGKYFVCWFKEKPTLEKLRIAMESNGHYEDDSYLNYLLGNNPRYAELSNPNEKYFRFSLDLVDSK